MVLGGSTVDELFVALSCTSIAAPVPEIRLLKVRTYAQSIMRNDPQPSRYYIHEHGDGVTILRGILRGFEEQKRTTGFKLGQDVGTILQVSMMQYSDFTRNMTCLHVFAHTDT